MKTEKIIQKATWSGDKKSVNLSIFDVQAFGEHKISVKGTDERKTIEVGEEIWEDEILDKAQEIIISQLDEYEIVNKDFIIE